MAARPRNHRYSQFEVRRLSGDRVAFCAAFSMGGQNQSSAREGAACVVPPVASAIPSPVASGFSRISRCNTRSVVRPAQVT